MPVAYLLGTFPSAVLVARSRGIDINAAGSGNPGASNVSRLLGRKLGIFVFVLDGLKGAISVGVGFLVFEYAGALMLACAAVVGHVFPITRKFKGGRGVATAGGAALALYPVPNLVLLALWIVVVKLTKKASLASLAICVGLPIGVAMNRLLRLDAEDRAAHPGGVPSQGYPRMGGPTAPSSGKVLPLHPGKHARTHRWR